MIALDKEKDFYIKEKFKKDDLISKKADDVFNSFLKGEIKMEENSSQNNNTNEVKIESKSKISKMKKVFSLVATFMIVFLAANAYAATQGYNNIFFIIKNILKNDVEVTDKEEILSDRDITISYQPIEITEGLKMQINRLVVQENNAKLFIRFEEKSEQPIYLHKFVVYDITNGQKRLLGEQKTLRDINEFNNADSIWSSEEIELSDMKNDTTKLELNVEDEAGTVIVSFEIDLDKKEIDVINKMQAELEKISEVELKEILGVYMKLKFWRDYPITQYKTKDEFMNQRLVEIASMLIAEEENYANDIKYTFEKMHKAMKEFSGKNIEEPITNLVSSIIYYDKSTDSYMFEPGDGIEPGLCLDISDITFLNGIYTVEFTYCYSRNDVDSDIQNIDHYTTTMKFKLNKDYTYTKYCIVDLDNFVSEYSELNKYKNDTVINNNSVANNITNSIVTENVIENTISNTIKNNESTNIISNIIENENIIENNSQNIDISKVDNYASTMAWTTFYVPGLKTRIPAEWNETVLDGIYSGNEKPGDISGIVEGLARGINRDTNEIIDSNMTIKFHMPEFIDYTTVQEYGEVIENRYGAISSGTGYSESALSGISWLEIRKNHEERPEGAHLYFCHVEPVDNETSGIGYVVEIIVDNEANYKVTNILNWIFGDVETTSF